MYTLSYLTCFHNLILYVNLLRGMTTLSSGRFTVLLVIRLNIF